MSKMVAIASPAARAKAGRAPRAGRGCSEEPVAEAGTQAGGKQHEQGSCGGRSGQAVAWAASAAWAAREYRLLGRSAPQPRREGPLA